MCLHVDKHSVLYIVWFQNKNLFLAEYVDTYKEFGHIYNNDMNTDMQPSRNIKLLRAGRRVWHLYTGQSVPVCTGWWHRKCWILRF